MKTIIVLISGNGSNLQALIDACANGTLPARIALVVSNKEGVYGLDRAQKAGIPILVKTLKSYKSIGKTRLEYDIDLAADIHSSTPNIDLVVLAGFMHILSKEFIQSFGMMINLHPALPGQFDGAHAIDRAFESFQKGLISKTGVMVHQVIPEVDKGPVILSQEIVIFKEDSLADLESRIHDVEHQMLVQGVLISLDKM